MAELPPEEVLLAAGWIRRSRRTGLLLSRPRIRQIFWVDFYRDAYAPEFEGEHPGIVVRSAQSLNNDTCIVVPVSSKEQNKGAHFHKLAKNPIPLGVLEGKDCYAVCDHLYTVNNCRLRPISSDTGKPMFPNVEAEDFVAIVSIIRKVLAPSLDYKNPETEVPATPDFQGNPQKTVGKDGRKIIGLPPKS